MNFGQHNDVDLCNNYNVHFFLGTKKSTENEFKLVRKAWLNGRACLICELIPGTNKIIIPSCLVLVCLEMYHV